jgi:hypothetical protein
MNEGWHCYHIFPIDFGWEFLPDLKQVIAQAAMQDACWIEQGISENIAQQIMEDFKFAMAAMRKRGWEGDFRDGPKVFFLPNDTDFVWGFVWKQDNNGETFVVSPRPLPWLSSIAV